MARRLPVYLLLDVSESMAGREIESLTTAISSITSTLRSNPYALETVWVSVIGFAGKAKTLSPLRELVSFVAPELPVGGGTNLAVGLEHLMKTIDADVRVGTEGQKGDWKPVVFLLTDGRPTDSPNAAVQKWNSNYRRKANLVAVSIGGQADLSVLRQLSEDVIVFNDAAPDAFAKFAQWISSSVSTQSQNAESGRGDRISLSKGDGDVVREVDERETNTNSGSVDERYAVFVGKCSKNKKPYLLKYQLAEGRPKYRFLQGVRLDDTYFELTDTGKKATSASTSDIDQGAPCPHCNSEMGFAVCNCGNLICAPGEGGVVVCSWCGNRGEFHYSSSGFNVNRGRG